MLRAVGQITAGAAAGALLVVVCAFLFVEVVRPLYWPARGGFDGDALMLFLFGPPVGAVNGAVTSAAWLVARWNLIGDAERLPFQPPSPSPRPPLDFGSLPRYPG